MIPLADDRLRYLAIELRGRSARPRRVLKRERGRETSPADDLQRLGEILLGLTRESTMMSVVMAACGIAWRTRSRIPRYFSARYERRIVRRIRSDPDCSGMCRARADVMGIGHRLDDIVGEFGRVR